MKKLSLTSGLAVCLVLVAGPLVMARTTRATLTAVFPGVDTEGNLDYGFRGSEGVVRATFNDRKGTVRVIGRAVVENASYSNQVFADAGVIDQFDISGAVVADIYRVNRRGVARYQGLLVDSTGF
jgi:hypothetical protein